MLRLFTDFNARDEHGACWNLIYDGTVVDDRYIKKGDKVILFHDPDDFEVVATVEFRFVKELNREAWVAIPDWSTKSIMRHADGPGGAHDADAHS